MGFAGAPAYCEPMPPEVAAIPSCERCRTQSTVQILPFASARSPVWWVRCDRCGMAWCIPKGRSYPPEDHSLISFVRAETDPPVPAPAMRAVLTFVSKSEFEMATPPSALMGGTPEPPLSE